jgi:hypothetical protein
MTTKHLSESDKIILSDYQGSPIAIILVVLLAILFGIYAGTWLFFHLLKLIMS